MISLLGIQLLELHGSIPFQMAWSISALLLRLNAALGRVFLGQTPLVEVVDLHIRGQIWH
jgi:hypothetical protein